MWGLDNYPHLRGIAKLTLKRLANPFGVVWYQYRTILEAGNQCRSIWGRQRSGVVPIDIVLILQHITGQDGNHVITRPDRTARNQFPDARQRRSGCRLTADTA